MLAFLDATASRDRYVTHSVTYSLLANAILLCGILLSASVACTYMYVRSHT